MSGILKLIGGGGLIATIIAIFEALRAGELMSITLSLGLSGVVIIVVVLGVFVILKRGGN